MPVDLDFSPMGPPAATASHGQAPADESFGQYPMSVIGIENAIRKADGQADSFVSGERVLNDGPIGFVVVSLRAWERRFPYDPWIPKELGELVRFYQHVNTPQSNAYARQAIAWIESDFASSPQAEALRSYVDSGVPAEPALEPKLQPVAVHAPRPAATPVPVASATPFDPWSRFATPPPRG